MVEACLDEAGRDGGSLNNLGNFEKETYTIVRNQIVKFNNLKPSFL